ncbi:MAG: hypothetical protein EPN84_08825 [Legionella sp.]|nr:MAG: hypothetical protein EPN84_08825 [Legionella sp.]
MGDDVFLFMKKMVKASGKNLERFFENFNYIPAMYFPVLQQLEQNFKKEQIKNHPSSYDQLLVCISTLETLRKELTPESEAALFEEGSPNYAVLVGSLVVNNSLTPIELISFFNQKLQAVYRKLLALPEQLNLDTSVFDNHPGLFLRLLAGRRHLKDHRLERVFDKCIEYDLRTDRDFNFFAYSLDQQDELGRRLAKHNERIKSDLKVAKINTDLAFSYPHKSSFSCITNDSIDWESLARAIYNDLNNLEGLLNPQIQTPLIQSLLMSITKIKSQVTKGKQVNLKPIYNGTLDNRLQRIHDQLTELLSTEKLSNEVKEHGMHFQQHYKDLKKEISKASSRQIKNEAIKKSFYIVPWDKNQLQSFILGDYLGCCLAPDGGQFQAMVQRRMDAAMMMHVVYDKDLQEPVCGNWLFFARNKNNPEEVFVVANFFEIRAGYGLNPQLRDRLVKELVDYTGKYAKLIGAKRFLICPLTYGLIPNFIGKFELEQINIEKIGGFFSPLSNEVVGQDSYYLTSLNVDSFFRYEDQDPKEQNSSLRIFARTAEINQTKPLAPPTLSRQSCEQ